MSHEETEGTWAQLPGRLIVISGPSGSGKSTLVRHLTERPELRLARSISATTRSPRPGEIDGRDYFFLTPPEFARQRAEMLESARVHDHWYGTPAQAVRQALAQGFCVLLVIDVQGGLQVRQKVPDAALIFVQPPSLQALEDRLRARGSEDERTIARRIAQAARELEVAKCYDIHVTNDVLDRAVQELASILTEMGCGARQNHD
jgi:guanylate kinase